VKKSVKTLLAVVTATASMALCFTACGHTHNYTSEVTKEATCEEPGVMTYTCGCGNSYTEPIPATGEHTFDTERWEHDETYHWHPATCACNRKDGEEEHIYKSGVCSECGFDRNLEIDKVYAIEENGETGYRITGLTETGMQQTVLNIPARYHGKDITAIDAYAFEENTVVTEVSVPSGVTELKRETFRGCTALEKVTLPIHLGTLGDAVFAGCEKLTEINLPKHLRTIGAYAFDGCASLEEINIPLGVMQLGAQAFANCSKLKEVTIPVAITGIGDNMFLNCSALTKVTMHEDLTSIGRQAFANCTSLSTIEFPAKLTAIRQSAFKGSGLTTVTVPDTVTEIGTSVFAECDSLTEATLSMGVKYHFGAIFGGCDVLSKLTIPFVGSNVAATEASTAFGYLFSMNEPENASEFTKAGDYYIPNALKTVTVLGGTVAEHAFDGCSHLETVYYNSDVVWSTETFTDFTATLQELSAQQ